MTTEATLLEALTAQTEAIAEQTRAMREQTAATIYLASAIESLEVSMSDDFDGAFGMDDHPSMQSALTPEERKADAAARQAERVRKAARPTVIHVDFANRVWGEGAYFDPDF